MVGRGETAVAHRETEITRRQLVRAGTAEAIITGTGFRKISVFHEPDSALISFDNTPTLFLAAGSIPYLENLLSGDRCYSPQGSFEADCNQVIEIRAHS